MAEIIIPSDVPELEFNTVELPPSIEIKESLVRIGEAGAFAKELISEDTRFGPYKGEIIMSGVKKYIDYRYAWEVYEKNSNVLRHTICAMDSKLSNWMRHVNCARFYEEQNILSVQDGFSIFYVAMKDIKPGEELLTWFDPKLIKRTKRRLSKMKRKPVGYTIELVPWSDEKKFVPEIIATKRARKKKVLSDMISLDENPMAITRTLQSLPKLPCTPKQLAQSSKYREMFASLIQKAETSPDLFKKKTPAKDKSKTKTKSAPIVVNNKFSCKSSVVNSSTKKNPGSSTSWKDVKSFVGASCTTKMKSSTVSTTDSEVSLQRNPKLLKPKKIRISIETNNSNALSDNLPLKPIVLKTNPDGSVIVEDQDETYILKDMVLQPECDELCTCLDKKLAMQSHGGLNKESGSYVIYFTLLPEHRHQGPDNKVIYRCDICGNAYIHVFSLKRHYLSIHINHRYLTPNDIQSCQIETFHINTQLDMSKCNFPFTCAVKLDNHQVTSHAPTDYIDKDNILCNNFNCISTGEVLSLKTLAQLVLEQKSKSSLNIDAFPETKSLADNNLEPKSIELNKNSILVPSLKDIESLPKEFTCDLEMVRPNLVLPQTIDLPTNDNSVADQCLGIIPSTQDYNVCNHSSGEVLSDSLEVDIVEHKDNLVSTVSDTRTVPKENTVLSLKEFQNSHNIGLTTWECLSLETKQKDSLQANISLVDQQNSSLPLVSSPTSKNLEDNCEKNVVLRTIDISESQENVVNNEINVLLEDKFLGTKAPYFPDISVDSDITLQCSTVNISQTDILLNSIDDSEKTSCTMQANINIETKVESIAKLTCESEVDKSALALDCLHPAPSEKVLTAEICTDGYQDRQHSKLNASFNSQPSTSCDFSPVQSVSEILPTVAAADDMNSGNVSLSSSADLIMQFSDFDSVKSVISSSQDNNESNCSIIPAVRDTSACVNDSACDTAYNSIASASSCVTDSNAVCTATNVTDNTPVSTNYCSTGCTPVSTTMSVVTDCMPVCNTLPVITDSTPVSTTMSVNTDSAPVSSSACVLISSTSSHINANSTVMSKTSNPLTSQVIIVTNFLFPIVTPSQKTSDLNVTSPLPTAPSPSIPKTLPLNNQTPGVPVVFISNMNAANSFLQSSTALKTIQTLQNSLNVMSLGNTSTIMTGTKMAIPVMCSNLMPVSSKPGLVSPAIAVQASKALSSTATDTVSCQTAGVPSPGMNLPPSVKQEILDCNQPEDLYRCHMCVLVFKTMSQLKNHIKNDPHRFKGGIKQYGCPQCSMRFSSKTNLIRHSLSHKQDDDSLKHRCFTCGKGFSTETYLKMHARFHTGRNFPCKYGCVDAYFPNAASLVKHLRSQHPGLDLKEYMKKVNPKHKKKMDQANVTPGQPSDASSIHIPNLEINKANKNPVHYSMTQPGIGFQAKRIKSKPSKVNMYDGFKVDTSRDNEMSKDSNDDNNAEEARRLFRCKMCEKSFFTHLRLLQHRTQNHGASQSVQEYLYEMSMDVVEAESSEYESFSEEISPPSSPKTFFRNVNRKGFENIKFFIDGGVEALKNWRKYLKVEDYVSWAEPSDTVEFKEPKIEWTFYNFPPSFVYRIDCTEYYDERVQEIKCEPNCPQRDSIDASECTDTSNGHLLSTTSDTAAEHQLNIKIEVEDNSYGDVSQEQGKDISIKVENQLELNQNLSPGHSILQPAFPDSLTTAENLPASHCIASANDESNLPEAINMEQISDDKLTKNFTEGSKHTIAASRLDSDINLLSSTESTSQNCIESLQKEKCAYLPQTTSNNVEPSQFWNDKSVNQNCSSPMKGNPTRYVLPDFPLKEKLEVLESAFMQGINLESKLEHNSSTKSLNVNISRQIHALNLHVPINQLSSPKISQLMQKCKHFPNFPSVEIKRHRTLSLPSLDLLSPNKKMDNSMESSLNISDVSRHDHRRYSIWNGQIHHKALKEQGDDAFCCPVIETVRKQESRRLRDMYIYEKASRDKETDGKQKKIDLEKDEFAKLMGLMPKKEFVLSHHAKKLEEHIIKPPEIWKNYENIWFGKKGTIAVVCSICHRHFSCWDLCLRHQLKKHPHIEPSSIEMERDNDVEDLYYYYPMKYGIVAQTQLVPDNLAPLEVYVCTRCSFPFKNLTKLHSHVIACDPASEMPTFNGTIKPLNNKKKLLPIMDRRLTQEYEPSFPKNQNIRNQKTYDKKKKKDAISTSQSKSKHKATSKPKESIPESSFNISNYFSVEACSKAKNYELLYNPQNHARKRELYKVLDQHQCHGCNLKFNSLSMLERHVKKCSGRDKLQSQKPLVSQIIPDDAAMRKQHTCRYCNKRFTFIKGVDLHYKRICAIRKVKEEENQLTDEDLAHEDELRRIIEHLKWSKALNKDSSDIIQGHVKVEEDGTLTRIVKEKKKGNVSTSIQQDDEEIPLASSTPNCGQVRSYDNLESTRDSGQLCKRLTRSSSFEKVSPASEILGKRRSSYQDNKKEKKARLSEPLAKEEDKKKPLKSKSYKSKKEKSSSAKKSVTSKKNISEPTKECNTRLPARKRGRPLKFDPSDLESSYTKKKRAEATYKGAAKSERSKPRYESSKLSGKSFKSVPTAKEASTAGKKTFKNTSASEPENKQKSPSLNNSKPCKKELSLAESTRLMEKMKQLKEAAKLEVDNQSKLKKAKQAKRAATKKASVLNNDEPTSTPSAGHSYSQPSELFKQLTQSETKIMTMKQVPDQSVKSSSNNFSPSSISTFNTLKRKSSAPAADTSAKKISTPGQSVSASNQNITKPSATVSKISILPKAKIFDEKYLGTAEDKKVSPKSAMGNSTLKISTLTVKPQFSGMEKSTALTSKPQPVSVRVVTLSPNGMNLLTYDSPADVPVKSGSVSISKPGENVPIIPTKVVRDTLNAICRSPPQQAGISNFKGHDHGVVPIKNIIAKPALAQSPKAPCIKITKPVSLVNETRGLTILNQPCNDSPASLETTAQNNSQEFFGISKQENPSNTFVTIGKSQGYSILKAPAGLMHEDSVLQIVGSRKVQNSIGNQVVINNQRLNTVKLESPTHKISGHSEELGTTGVIKSGPSVKLGSRPIISKFGEKINLLSPTKLRTPTSLVLSTGLNTVLVSQAAAKVSPGGSSLLAGTKLRTPPSRFTSPSSSIGTNMMTPGTHVVKIESSASHFTPSKDVDKSLHLNNNASSSSLMASTEKNVLLGAVPRKSAPAVQVKALVASQAAQQLTKQPFISIGAVNRPKSQPTIIVQHESMATSPQLSGQHGISGLPSAHPITQRCIQSPIENSENYIATDKPFQKQSRLIRQPNSLLSSQIMISLDDGTTALLDPDSLAQFLTMSPSLTTTEGRDSDQVADPEHVMVSMAQIQPTHQPSDDISWPCNGSVDLTDTAESTCDL